MVKQPLQRHPQGLAQHLQRHLPALGPRQRQQQGPLRGAGNAGKAVEVERLEIHRWDGPVEGLVETR